MSKGAVARKTASGDGVAVGRKRIVAGLAVFVAMVVLIVAVNSVSHGLDFGRSVSRYVGFEAWSAALFAVGNGFVVAMVASYLWKVGEARKMPRLFYYLVFLIAATLILLSVFPIGFCDFDGHVSLVSRIHEVSSRVMFIAMMLVAAMLAGNPYGSRRARIASAVFVLYALLCVVGYLTGAGWFLAGVLVWETAYIVYFIATCIAAS